MTNHYIVNATTREIWADVPEPQIGKNWSPEDRAKSYYGVRMDEWNSRPHYPYSDKLNWRDGQRVELNVHFRLRCEAGCKDVCSAIAQNNDYSCLTIAIPLPSKDKEEKTVKPPIGLIPEWRFRELRIEDIDAAIERYKAENYAVPIEWNVERYQHIQWLKACLPTSPYLKQTFGIDISNK
jgi:hypothetical protein